MKNVIRYGLVILVAFGILCAMPHAAKAQGRIEGSFERTLNVGGMVNLDVSTGSGSIDLRRGGNGRVEIRGRIRAGNSFFRSNAADAEAVSYTHLTLPTNREV